MNPFSLFGTAALTLALALIPAPSFAEDLKAPHLVSPAQVLVASHRGSIRDAPENTLAAFRWAESIGADLVEADLRVAQDGSLVVIHDARVNRTTNGRGQVRRLPLAELKALDAGNGQPIPTFAEALAFVRTSDLQLLLDVKDSERIDAQSLIAAIQGQRVERQVLIGSRSMDLARELKAIAPELKVLAMVSDARSIDDFLALEVDAVRLWARWVRRDPELAQSVRRAGADVWLTTGGLKGQSLARALRVADGVITDHPADALHLTRALAQRQF